MGVIGFIPSNIPKIENEANTKYLNAENIIDRDTEIQSSQPFSYSSYSGTLILDADVVLTGAQLDITSEDSGGNFSGSLTVYISGKIIGQLNVSGANGFASKTIFIPLPNWEIKAGEKIQISSGGSGDTGLATVLGYYS